MAQSFQEVYDTLEPRIRRYLRRLVGPSEAEDLTQEVFARVDRALPYFQGKSKVSTWVYRIATNVAFDRLRSPALRRASEVTPATGKLLTIGGPDIEQKLVRQEMNECIRRFVDGLPPTYRAVVLLSEDEGLSNAEIAQALGLSLDTVKIRLHRARARLRQELGSGCSLYRDERNELACEPRAGGVSSGG